MNEEPMPPASGEPVPTGEASGKHELNLKPSTEFAAEQQSSAPGIAVAQAQAPAPTTTTTTSVPAQTYTAPDRTDVQGIYPQPAAVQQSQQLHTGFSSSLPSSASEASAAYNQPSTMVWDLLTLATGFISVIGYMFMTFKVDNSTVSAVVATIISAVAIFFSYKSYGAKQHMNPLVVMGIAAATFTLIIVSITLMSEVLLRSAYSTGLF